MSADTTRYEREQPDESCDVARLRFAATVLTDLNAELFDNEYGAGGPDEPWRPSELHARADWLERDLQAAQVHICADTACSETEAAHRAAVSTFDTAHGAHESAAMSAMNVVDSARASRPGAANVWSAYFFVLGVILGIMLAVAGYAVISCVIAESRRSIQAEQPAPAVECSVPQLTSPTRPGNTAAPRAGLV